MTEKAKSVTSSNIYTELNNKGTAYGATPQGDIYVYDRDLNNGNDLIINNLINTPTQSTKLVIVKNGDLTIRKDINPTSLNSSLAFVVLDGNIFVDGYQDSSFKPAAYYQFNDTPRDNTNNQVDDSRNIYNANWNTSNLPDHWGTGYYDGGGQFDGVNQQVVSNSSPLILDTNNPPVFTISAWFKPSASADPAVNDLGGIALSDQNYPRLFYRPQNKWFTFQLKSSSTVVNTSSVSLDQWHHITGTYDQTNLSIYLDGVLQETKAATNKDLRNITKDMIKIGNAQRFYKGAIDEVRIFKTVRNQEQILQDMDEGIVGGGLFVDVRTINAGLITLKQSNGNWDGQIVFKHRKDTSSDPKVIGMTDCSNTLCRSLKINGMVVGSQIYFNRQPQMMPRENFGVTIKYDSKISKLPALSKLVNPKVQENKP